MTPNPTGSAVAPLLPDARVAASEGGPFSASQGISVRTPEMPADDFGEFVDASTGGPYRYVVEPGLFRVLGLRLLAGRLLEASDGPSSPPAAVVNQTMARALVGGASPVGRCVLLGTDTRCTTIEGARATLLALAVATVGISVLAALVWPIARATGEELLLALKAE